MNYKKKISSIDCSTIIRNIKNSSINFILYNIFCETKYDFITYIVENNFEIELTEKEIHFYSKDIEIIKFPEWNTVPFDVSSPEIQIQSDRMESIYKLINYDLSQKNKKTIFIISKNALIQKILSKKDYNFLNFFINQNISIEEIKDILENNCYENVETCINLGNFSINNNKIDLITFNNQAYRISLKNNIINEIKNFDPNTQITFNNHDKILVLPIKEVIFNKQNIQNFKQNYRNYFKIFSENDIIYKNISTGILYNGSENWLPLFYKNKLETIFNYIPKNSLLAMNNNFSKNIKKSINLTIKYYNLRTEDLKHTENKFLYNPIQPNLLYITNKELTEQMNNYINIIFDNRKFSQIFSTQILNLKIQYLLLKNFNFYFKILNNYKNSIKRSYLKIFKLNDFFHIKYLFNEDNLNNNFKKINLNFTKVPNFFNESKEVFQSLKEYLTNS